MRYGFIFKCVKWPLLLCLLCQLTGCLEDIVPERKAQERGSFGHEFYSIIYKNTENSSNFNDTHLATFRAYEGQFVDAIDNVAVEEDLGALNQLFRDIVPLYENMLYPSTLRKIGTVVGELKDDSDAIDALSFMTGQPSVLAHPEDANPLANVFTYKDLFKINQDLLDLLLKNASGPYNPTNQLLKDLSIGLKNLEKDADFARISWRFFNALTETNPAYAPASGRVQEAVRLDRNGSPKLRVFNPNSPSETHDLDSFDADGWAKRDDLGYIITKSGARIGAYEVVGYGPYQRLENGHVAIDGKERFEYFDLQQTPLAYLAREAHTLLEDNTLDEALRASHSLLGASEKRKDADGTYMAFSQQSGLVQLMAAVLATLDHDAVGGNFEAGIHMLRHEPELVAGLIHDIRKIIDIVDETPSKLSLDNNLIDRLMPYVQELAQTEGLLEDLIEAAADPRSAELAPILADLSERRNSSIQCAEDGPYQQCFAVCDATFKIGTLDRLKCIRSCPIDEILGTERVDRNAPESFENRSIFQRISNLMWEASNTPYEVMTEKLIYNGGDLTPMARSLGPVMTFDNVAKAYLLTLTGDLVLADHIEPSLIQIAKMIGLEVDVVANLISYMTSTLFKLDLSLRPTTAEVTRMFNKKEITATTEKFTFGLEVARCRSGFACYQANADTLYAIEASGLADALYPVVAVLNKYKKTALFAEMMAVIFEYYPSGDYDHRDINGDLLPLHAMDFRSVEPILIRAFSETDVLARLMTLGDKLVKIELSDGSKLASRFAQYVNYLFTPDPELRNLAGQNSTKDPSGNVISPLSPAYLYVDALREISNRTRGDTKLQDQISNAARGLAKITIETEVKANGKIGFVKPAGILIVSRLLSFLHALYLDQDSPQKRHAWINDKALPKLKKVVTSRLLHAYFALFAELDKDSAALENFRRFVLHILESDKADPTHVAGFIYQIFPLILEQEQLIKIGRFMSSPIDPDRDWSKEGYPELSLIVNFMTVANAFNGYDDTGVFNRVFYRLIETDSHKQSNLSRLLETGRAILRVNPGHHIYDDAKDLQVFMNFAHKLFTDDSRGIERIYDIIDFSVWGTAGRPSTHIPEKQTP